MLDIDKNQIAQNIMSIVHLLYKATFVVPPRMNCATIPPTQMQALISLKVNQSMNMTELAGTLRISIQQLTKVVHALVEKKLVVRKSALSNRRLVLIELTDEGYDLIDQIIKGKAESVAHFLSGLTTSQTKIVLEALTIINSLLIKKDV